MQRLSTNILRRPPLLHPIHSHQPPLASPSPSFPAPQPLTPSPTSLSPTNLQTLYTHLQNGTLIPGPLVSKLVQRVLLTSTITTKGYILDGYPRDLNQAKLLTSNFNNPQTIDVRPDLLIVLYCKNEETLKKRMLKRGRMDDSMKTIEKRLQNYYKDENEILQLLKNGINQTVNIHCGGSKDDLIYQINQIDLNRRNKICILGAPGTGKGVVGQVLKKNGNRERIYIGVGDLLRKMCGLQQLTGFKDLVSDK